ncbi:MAG: hypothetical protein A2X12_11525 [Bacteroidetes bacterium GWE2_29_8]|nr:MAG: hypothetical protein A2X12_11525 [Bacteroidetes bacterium GWE2_29_8]OFY13968.1 MAG: hypothetical protein A2X02_09105 [Bacteroidetes bacterium GWF2_29_10]
MNYIIVSNLLKPYFNFAIEDFYLKNIDNDSLIVIMYVNDNSIIVGKNQNYLKEVDYKYIISNNVPVYRRASGGGTVYHDKGNLNVSFILNRSNGFSNHKHSYFSEIINDFLIANGIQSNIGKRNEILVDNYKISGCAQYIYKNSILHHLTLLFDANLLNVYNSLKNNSNYYNDNHTCSFNNKVVNINNINNSFKSIVDFQNKLLKYLTDKFSLHKIQLNNESKEIWDIASNKYNKDEWNLFYNSNYCFSNEYLEGSNLIKIEIKVKKSFIDNFSITLNNKMYYIENATNKRHIFCELNKILEEFYNKNMISFKCMNMEKLVFKCF